MTDTQALRDYVANRRLEVVNALLSADPLNPALIAAHQSAIRELDYIAPFLSEQEGE